MKTLSACLYCARKKECLNSVQAHSFTDFCFMAEDEGVRTALDDLRALSKLCSTVEAAEKINGVVETMVLQTWGKNALQENLCLLLEKQDMLLKYIADSGCEIICKKAREYPCTATIECYECDEQCNCKDCKNTSKFALDWDKLAKLYPANKEKTVSHQSKMKANLFTERNKIN